MSVHRPSALRGVPKTRVRHLFVARTPVICFLRARRRLMRSDWPFNFAFINSVGWRLYRGFVRPVPRASETAGNEMSVDRRLRSLCPCCLSFSSFSPPSHLPLSVFPSSLFLPFSLPFSVPRDRTLSRAARDYHSFVFRESSERNKCLIYCLWNVVPLPASPPLRGRAPFFTGSGKNSSAYAKYRNSSPIGRLIET